MADTPTVGDLVVVDPAYDRRVVGRLGTVERTMAVWAVRAQGWVFQEWATAVRRPTPEELAVYQLSRGTP